MIRAFLKAYPDSRCSSKLLRLQFLNRHIVITTYIVDMQFYFSRKNILFLYKLGKMGIYTYTILLSILTFTEM